MRSKRATRVFVLFVLLGSARAWAQDVTIVANKTVKASQISQGQLHDLFTGTRSRFADGSRAVPVVLRGGPVHEVFLRNHVGDSPDEFRNRWRKMVFTGEGSMLKDFASEAALLEYVAATPGAIGYVSRLPEASSVKVLEVTH
jgi:hypothetical protein